MLTLAPSAYLAAAAKLRDGGYHPLPVMPGAKVPGVVLEGQWRPMPGWQNWCDRQPPEFMHDRWTDWDGAGVCIAHGAVVGLDVDTDRKEVADAAVEAAGPSPVRRRGRKGWMGYYRPGAAAEGQVARLRWYDEDGKVCAELLLHGTQSVIPPTIHPETGQPYRWITPDTLEGTALADLPELPPDAVARLDAAFAAVGLTRKKPGQRPDLRDYGRAAATDHDLEKPHGRSVNDRAMRAIDAWWPALGMPKSRQRGPGAWEAVPFWRPSGGGRMVDARNPNLRAVPTGIVDFGADRSYTPIDVVMAARDCSYDGAVDWLAGYIELEARAEVDLSAMLARTAEPAPVPAVVSLERWSTTPAFPGSRSMAGIRPVAMPSDAEFEALVPREAQAFPIADFAACPGLLGEMAAHIDAASVTATEAGALAVTLPLLGAVMGRAYETPSRLRTNIYTVALGGSGKGKTSLVSPAKELLQLAMLADLLGQDSIASGSGLLRMLVPHPHAKVVFLDEFGHMLQQIGSAGSGIHSKQIITEFTRLYSAANTLYTGTAYAGRDPDPIDCPHLCLFGMATPEQFWRAFGSSSLEDGSIARYLVFPIGATGAKDPDARGQARMVDALKDVADATRGRVRGNLGMQGVLTVPMDEDAERDRLHLRETISACADYAEVNAIRGGPAILLRVVENALKIALVSAIGRSPGAPRINGHDFAIGHALARWSATSMIWNIASHVADNQTERDVNDVERFILEAGERGRLWRDVQSRFRRIRGRDLKEIAEALEREGAVRVEQIANPAGGHPVRRYFKT